MANAIREDSAPKPRNIDIRIRRGTPYIEVLRALIPLAWHHVQDIEFAGDDTDLKTPCKILIGIDEDLTQICQDFAALMGFHISYTAEHGLSVKPRPSPDLSLWSFES